MTTLWIAAAFVAAYLIGIDPQVCVQLLGAKPVQCAIDL